MKTLPKISSNFNSHVTESRTNPLLEMGERIWRKYEGGHLKTMGVLAKPSLQSLSGKGRREMLGNKGVWNKHKTTEETAILEKKN